MRGESNTESEGRKEGLTTVNMVDKVIGNHVILT